MNEPVIAILSPNQNAYSETFIQAHRQLNGTIKFYHGKPFPINLEGEQPQRDYTLKQRGHALFKRKILNSPLNTDEMVLLKSFKSNKINIVLAEYGPTAVKALKVCQRLKIPLIVHFHGVDASMTAIKESYARGYREVFSYASYVVGVSEKMMSDLTAMGAPRDKLILNPYGPDESFFKVKYKPEGRKFFAVGRFVDKKAPHLTLLAFKKVLETYPDAILIMGGDGPLLPICRDMAGAMQLSENVIFPGSLNRDQIKSHMSNSLAFVQHSVTAADGDSEGTPVVILEAGAAGLPVISTYHAGIPDVVQNNETGYLVNEKDVDGMATSMIKVLEDPEKAKKMGEAARQRIKDEFSIEKHLNILNQLIEHELNMGSIKKRTYLSL